VSTRAARLGPALLLALLAASLVVGALVFRARTPDLALEVPRIERDLRLGAEGSEGTAQIRFFVRFDEPEATVQVVGAERAPVRVLYEGELFADQDVVCVWDGRDDAGELVIPDDYRLRVVLPGEDRDMVYPRRIDARGVGGTAGAEEPDVPVCAPAEGGTAG
jgi:hypothetical protein